MSLYSDLCIIKCLSSISMTQVFLTALLCASKLPMRLQWSLAMLSSVSPERFVEALECYWDSADGWVIEKSVWFAPFPQVSIVNASVLPINSQTPHPLDTKAGGKRQNWRGSKGKRERKEKEHATSLKPPQWIILSHHWLLVFLYYQDRCLVYSYKHKVAFHNGRLFVQILYTDFLSVDGCWCVHISEAYGSETSGFLNF